MIDVHTHILPQMDDGSKSAEQSVQMLDAMQAQGVRLLAATPHFDMRKENIDEFLARRSKAIKRLNAARTEDDPKIIPGAEVLYCGVSLSRMEKVEKLCIGDGNYMLVETLTMQWDDFFEDCLYQLLAEQNITPIVAHIDRYLPYRKNRAILHRLKKRGVLMQVNAGFFLRRLSRGRALRLLKNGMIHVIGSDCHDTVRRPPNLGAAGAVIEKHLGKQYTMQLTRQAEHVLMKQDR